MKMASNFIGQENTTHTTLGNKNLQQEQNKSKKSHRISFDKRIGIVAIPMEEKNETDFNHTYFNWKIASFRRLTDAKSDFVIGSPTFTCSIAPKQISEWYLSLNYSGEGTGKFKVGLFLKGLKGDGSNEIRAHVSLSVLRTRGGPVISCGSVKRNFRVREQGGSIFRRSENVGERRCCEKHSRSDCHEWFDLVSMDALKEIQHLILSDNVLNLRAEMKVWTSQERAVWPEQINIWKANSSIPKKLPPPIRYWDKRPKADCVIMCLDEDFKVHKSLLSAASPVFAAMIDDMRDLNYDYNPEVLHTQAMSIDDIDSPIMEIILQYIYSGTFGSFDTVEMTPEIATQLLQATKLYKLHSVKNKCFLKMLADLDLYKAGHFAVLAENFKATPNIKYAINKFLRRNWSVLQQSEEFRDLFKANPEAFEFVFSVLIH